MIVPVLFTCAARVSTFLLGLRICMDRWDWVILIRVKSARCARLKCRSLPVFCLPFADDHIIFLSAYSSSMTSASFIPSSFCSWFQHFSCIFWFVFLLVFFNLLILVLVFQHILFSVYDLVLKFLFLFLFLLFFHTLCIYSCSYCPAACFQSYSFLSQKGRLLTARFFYEFSYIVSADWCSEKREFRGNFVPLSLGQSGRWSGLWPITSFGVNSSYVIFYIFYFNIGFPSWDEREDLQQNSLISLRPRRSPTWSIQSFGFLLSLFFHHKTAEYVNFQVCMNHTTWNILGLFITDFCSFLLSWNLLQRIL